MKFVIADEISAVNPVWEGGRNKEINPPPGAHQVVHGSFHMKDCNWQEIAMPSFFFVFLPFVHYGPFRAT